MRHHDAIVLLLGENGRNLDFTVWPTCFLLLGRHLLSFFSAVFLSSCLPDTLFSAATASCCGHNRLLAHPYYFSIAFGKNECNSQWSSPTLNYFDLIMTSDGFNKKKLCVSFNPQPPLSARHLYFSTASSWRFHHNWKLRCIGRNQQLQAGRSYFEPAHFLHLDFHVFSDIYRISHSSFLSQSWE